MTISALVWGVLFGSIGFGYFIYGRKQKAIVPLLSGVGLMVLPMAVSNVYILVLLGVILLILPYYLKI